MKQTHGENTVTLGIEPEIETVNGAELTYTVTLTTPNGEEKVYTGSPKEIAALVAAWPRRAAALHGACRFTA